MRHSLKKKSNYGSKDQLKNKKDRILILLQGPTCNDPEEGNIGNRKYIFPTVKSALLPGLFKRNWRDTW